MNTVQNCPVAESWSSPYPTANVPADSSIAFQIPHILQTWLGMAQYNGAPQQRRLPDSVADLRAFADRTRPDTRSGHADEKYKQKLVVIAIAYLESSWPTMGLQACDTELEGLAANAAALRSNVTLDNLKFYMKSRTRLDLEQAVAVIVSAFMSEGRIDDATKLIKDGNSPRDTCSHVDGPGNALGDVERPNHYSHVSS